MKHRELERKYLIEEVDLRKCYKLSRRALGGKYATKGLFCTTEDIYFRTPKKNSFLRIRRSLGSNTKMETEELLEITYKKEDRGGIQNRLEFNWKLKDLTHAEEFFTILLGKESGRINKEESILFLKDRSVISFCKVKADGKIYLEIESDSFIKIRKIEKILVPLFKGKLQNISFFNQYINI